MAQQQQQQQNQVLKTGQFYNFSDTEPKYISPKSAFLGCCRSVDEFQKLNRIGEGTYGIVYRVTDKKTKATLALKRIRMENESDGLPVSSLREITLLKRLVHENVVRVQEVVVGQELDSIFMVMEYCEQDLATLLDSMRQPYSFSEVKCLMQQLLTGLCYCHEQGVIHRDLKLSNLLLTSNGILKIADFGLARSIPQPRRPMTPKVVTLWYRAPELLFGDPDYTEAVDLWSVGCIFGELLRHRPLLPGNKETDQILLICKLLGTPHEGIWRGFSKLPFAKLVTLPRQGYLCYVDLLICEGGLCSYDGWKSMFSDLSDGTIRLLKGLLTYDPKLRLNVHQSLLHDYFQEAPMGIFFLSVLTPSLAAAPALLPTFPEIRNDSTSKKRYFLDLF